LVLRDALVVATLATLIQLAPFGARPAALALGKQGASTETVCFDGEIGAGPKLRRAILALRSESGKLAGGELELHGRPLRSVALQLEQASDGSLRANALEEADALVLETAPPGRDGETRGSVTLRGKVSELELRPARPVPETDWVLGDWRGTAVVARFGLHITRGPCGLLAGTFDSPDQGQTGLPLTGVRASEDVVVLEAKYIDMTISIARGTGDTRAAELVQGALRTPLILDRGAWETGAGRPQDPRPPYPYEERAAQYVSRSPGIRLAGTLTVPREPGPHPALVLVSGSGAQDRDELVAGHRPFLVLADYLTRLGYAVLRVDDRGVGGSSGDVLRARLDDGADDVGAGLEWLRAQPGIDPDRIGVLGHSEGGFVAPMVAARDPRVSFVVLLGAPAIQGRDLLLAQRSALSAAAGDPEDDRLLDLELLERIFEVLDSRPPEAELESRVETAVTSWLAVLPEPRRAAAEAMLAARTPEQDAASLALWRTAWFQSLYHHDPTPSLAGMRVPVLAVYGELDLQVPPGLNAPALQAALGAGGDSRFTLVRLPGVNHMMQRAKTGRIEEYAEIEETIAPDVLQAIGDFLARVAPPSTLPKSAS
jgi:pimeloyl-ACP methyl ester carboxylesterase